jgi:hypothetical protein
LATCPDQQGGFPRKRWQMEVLNNSDGVSTVIASEIASSGEALPPGEGSVGEGTRSTNARAESQQEQDEALQASHIALPFEHAPWDCKPSAPSGGCRRVESRTQPVAKT